MKRLVSFKRPDQSLGYGFVRDGLVFDCSQGQRSLLNVIREGDLADVGSPAGTPLALADVELQTPVIGPEKIICVGVNYANRNEEYKDGSETPRYPSLFVRFQSSFVGHDRPIIRPRESVQLDYEGEIVLVIGRKGRRIRRELAGGYIAGFTLANDGTVRDWVRHAKFNVTQGKNFDESGSIGPWIVPVSDVDLSGPLRITTRVNGEVRQDDTTDNMIFDFDRLIEYISMFTTLQPGDLILTGTPTGAGARFDPPRWLEPGDVVEVAVPGIGVLKNAVAEA